MYMILRAKRHRFVALITQHQPTMLLDILIASSAGCLGIFLGAQITEGVLFVPYWKSLSPREFFALHQQYGSKIYQFFAPLTIIATILPVITVGYGLWTQSHARVSLVLMGLATIAFFSTYYLFFKASNKQFADASIPADQLPAELRKWGNWHWGRIVFEGIACICSIIALMQI